MAEQKHPMDGGPVLPTLFFFFLLSSAQAAVVPATPTVRILIEKAPGLDQLKKGITVEGFDMNLYEATSTQLLHEEPKKAQLHFTCDLAGRIHIQAPNKTLQTKEPLRLESRGGFLRIGDSQYRDALFIHPRNGECVVINRLDLEKYVAGLLNSEMNAGWNLNTLRAQAVAARTYAIYQMREGATSSFDLNSTQKDQVYAGAHMERARALRAVEETKGQILTFDGKPIKAFYHSTCGGRTEKTEAVWGINYAYMKPVRCGFCNTSPRYEWSLSQPIFEFERALKEKNLIKGSIYTVRVIDRNETGRARFIEIVTTMGRYKIHAVKIRMLLGASFVRSTDFIVTRVGGMVNFVGKGAGHGVGLCQWGARVMGAIGRKYQTILSHYYPEAKITTLY